MTEEKGLINKKVDYSVLVGIGSEEVVATTKVIPIAIKINL